jgi:hypothetical protein
MSQGPNVKRLIAIRIGNAAIPNGCENPMGEGLAFLVDRDRVTQAARAATRWVEEALAAVKSAPDNPYGDDDEVIAGELLRRIACDPIERRRRWLRGLSDEASA